MVASGRYHPRYSLLLKEKKEEKSGRWAIAMGGFIFFFFLRWG